MTQENKTIDILEMNVEDTELIVRAWRALQDMQIFKVKDLVALKREEITAKWTMGKRTLDHVIDFMIDNKLLFAGEVETDQLPLQLAMNKLLRTPLQDCNFPVRMKEILHVNGARDIRHLLTLPRLHVLAWLGRKYFQELTDFLKEKGLKFDSVADKEHEELMKNNHVVYLMIEECGFTIRTNNELKACKIVSVAQLLVMTEKEFLSFSGVHRKTLAEVKEFLQKK
jgi:DNA-directed RNA polymerase alpha subunit